MEDNQRKPTPLEVGKDFAYLISIAPEMYSLLAQLVASWEENDNDGVRETLREVAGKADKLFKPLHWVPASSIAREIAGVEYCGRASHDAIYNILSPNPKDRFCIHCKHYDLDSSFCFKDIYVKFDHVYGEYRYTRAERCRENVSLCTGEGLGWEKI